MCRIPGAAARMAYRYELLSFSREVGEAYLRLLPHQANVIAGGKLEWKFEAQPAGPGIAATARDGDRIVGLCALIANKLRVEGSHLIGYQAMDTVVAPEARGRNAFVNMITCFYEEAGAAAVYGFPNANAGPGWFGRLGWTRLGSAPFLFRPLRANYFLRRVSRRLPQIPLPYFKRPSASVQALGREDLPYMEEAWLRFSRSIACAVERDAEYLRWRIFDHPTETYRVLGNGADSFVVGSLAEKHGGRIGYLMEAVGPPRDLPGMIVALVHEHAEAEADAVLAWCPRWAPNYGAYRAAGFYPLPDRFRPIDISFGARQLDGRQSALTKGESWYLSYLDSDTV